MKKSLTIRRALISVDNKNHLRPIVEALNDRDVQIIASGGTAEAIQALNINVTDISIITGMKESFGGRVKTIHPSIYAAILARRDCADHCEALANLGIDPIDLVVITPYDFSGALENHSAHNLDLIEKIDVGGIALLRAAAKAYEFVVVLSSVRDYQDFLDEFTQDGQVSYHFRRRMAIHAFARTATYDAHIAKWFSDDKRYSSTNQTALPPVVLVGGPQLTSLRYGENSHQTAALYGTLSSQKRHLETYIPFSNHLSINNIRDSLTAIRLAHEFKEPAVAIIKHGNPCGTACAESPDKAWQKAHACDPQSAFGGVIAFNRYVDCETIQALGPLKIDILIVPELSSDAKNLFETRYKTARLLVMPHLPPTDLCYFPIGDDLLVQTCDSSSIDIKKLHIVSKRTPGETEIQDMVFASIVAKYTASNAIVLAKNKMTIGIGSGQMSRIDAMKIALDKEASYRHLHDTYSDSQAIGSVAASDGFFPFPDSVKLAAEKGIASIIQPGGSVRDHESIKVANDYNISMIFTGTRHFRH